MSFSEHYNHDLFANGAWVLSVSASDFGDLDARYGPLKSARSSKSDEADMKWEKGRSPLSVCELDENCGVQLRLMREACVGNPFLTIANSFFDDLGNGCQRYNHRRS